jgi:hypothetical protein
MLLARQLARPNGPDDYHAESLPFRKVALDGSQRHAQFPGKAFLTGPCISFFLLV